ncbi:MAG: right-handed parallel beta-helix repeat-containing protein, partial [Candidatus Heimdallarchaeaceae archaeon]
NSIITDNTIREIEDACIYLFGGDNITVNGNNVGNSKYGIYSVMLEDSLLDNNEFYQTDLCLFITQSDNCTISETYSTTSLDGIWISASSDLLVEGNTILNADWGIYAYDGVISSRFENNTCMYGFSGIGVADSSNCTFESNNLNYNDHGLYFLRVNYSLILNNSCSYNNEIGLWIVDSTNCTFRYNLIQNNTLYGASFQSSHNNTLNHNAFLDNYLPIYSQAYDDTGTNIWYSIGLGEGNYWSGWNSGLGAYSIDGPGSASDPFPLDTNPL